MKARIVFMGTPEFACPSLEALIENGYDVVGAFTQPDRPVGRGHKVRACPAKELAAHRGIEVFQFERVRRAEGVEALKNLRPDVMVTAAFGQILSREILEIPRCGTVNVHASLFAQAPGSGSDQLGDFAGRCGDRRHHNADRCGAGYRGDAPSAGDGHRSGGNRRRTNTRSSVWARRY